HAEAVADAISEQSLDVGAGLASSLLSGFEEGVVLGDGAVIVDAQDRPRQVGVVGLRAAEGVIGPGGLPGTHCQVLQLAAPANVTDQDQEFGLPSVIVPVAVAGALPVAVAAPGLEYHDTTVMVAADRLPGRVGLEGAQPDQILLECQLGAVPYKTV